MLKCVFVDYHTSFFKQTSYITRNREASESWILMTDHFSLLVSQKSFYSCVSYQLDGLGAVRKRQRELVSSHCTINETQDPFPTVLTIHNTRPPTRQTTQTHTHTRRQHRLSKWMLPHNRTRHKDEAEFWFWLFANRMMSTGGRTQEAAIKEWREWRAKVFRWTLRTKLRRRTTNLAITIPKPWFFPDTTLTQQLPSCFEWFVMFCKGIPINNWYMDSPVLRLCTLFCNY